jgi:hypothetical protein
MNEGTFEKMERSEKRMYGPRGIVICGYPPAEHAPLAQALEQIGFGDRPFIFVTDGDSGKTLGEVLTLGDRWGMGQSSQMARAMIMSGFTQQEVHTIMSAYRKVGLPNQLWATLTPVSETWPIEKLLGELAAEAEAMKMRESQEKTM